MGTRKFTEDQKNRLCRIAFNFGEDLMPNNCADIIARQFPKHCKDYGLRELAWVIKDMMERCGFCCERREALEEAMYLRGIFA